MANNTNSHALLIIDGNNKIILLLIKNIVQYLEYNLKFAATKPSTYV
jgi:hypothetical protein